MARPTPEYIAEATALVVGRVRELKLLSYDEASKLPEVVGDDVVIAGARAQVTTYRQSEALQLEGEILVVVLVAKPGLLGMSTFHIERGLVFSSKKPTRNATERELQNSGG